MRSECRQKSSSFWTPKIAYTNASCLRWQLQQYSGGRFGRPLSRVMRGAGGDQFEFEDATQDACLPEQQGLMRNQD